MPTRSPCWSPKTRLMSVSVRPVPQAISKIDSLGLRAARVKTGSKIFILVVMTARFVAGSPLYVGELVDILMMIKVVDSVLKLHISSTFEEAIILSNNYSL